MTIAEAKKALKQFSAGLAVVFTETKASVLNKQNDAKDVRGDDGKSCLTGTVLNIGFE